MSEETGDSDCVFEHKKLWDTLVVPATTSGFTSTVYFPLFIAEHTIPVHSYKKGINFVSGFIALLVTFTEI